MDFSFFIYSNLYFFTCLYKRIRFIKVKLIYKKIKIKKKKKKKKKIK